VAGRLGMKSIVAFGLSFSATFFLLLFYPFCSNLFGRFSDFSPPFCDCAVAAIKTESIMIFGFGSDAENWKWTSGSQNVTRIRRSKGKKAVVTLI